MEEISLKYRMILMVFLALLFTGCTYSDANSPNLENTSNINTLFASAEIKTGDAKIFKDKVIAGADGCMTILNKDGTVYNQFKDIPANWIYVLEEPMMAVSGSGENAIRLTRFAEDYSVLDSRVLFSSDNLLIDPVIFRNNDIWIVTYTEIIGTVNNADPENENGHYIVHCYISEDLQTWIPADDIISGDNNIEDGDMFSEDNALYYIYEKESYDKGPSSINIISSVDHGKTWNNESEIIPLSGADNEIAAIYKNENGYSLYYSSDRENIGESYNGSAVYRAELSGDFKVIDTEKIDLDEDKGILLYDVRQDENRTSFLYVQNYSIENNLCYKEIIH